MLPVAAADNLTSNRPTESTESTQRSTPPLHTGYKGGWSATCLRPQPPLRPGLARDGSTANNSSSLCSGKKTTSCSEDAMILEVIEAYSSAANFGGAFITYIYSLLNLI